MRPDRLYFIGVLAVLALNIIFALGFMTDPLGLSPVLDARENLAWAERIADGDLPAEPMYRALLYPAILALLVKMGLLSTALVTGFGVLCHGLNAFLVAQISKSLWSSQKAAWLGGLIYGAYPVAMWFAVQALDITLGISFFLGAVATLLSGSEDKEKGMPWVRLLIIGILGGLAVVTRPNFLPAVLCLPFLAVLRCGGLAGWRSVFPVGAGLALILLAQGGVNHALSGKFRILPWQGAYNLYAANRDGANGKFFSQQVAFDAIPEGMNPTRMESEYLYRQATGADGVLEVDDMNAYWRGRMLSEIAESPADWIGLMVRKVVYLFNDWEQYNNLTYAYHKERFQPLKWNPLGWGILLLGAALGTVLARKHLSASKAAIVGMLFLTYAAGVLLFFVSARFRLPLTPLLCVFFSGLSLVSWQSLKGRRGLIAGALLLLGAAFVYGNWWDARDLKSFRQDRLLLAKASLKSGQAETALRLSGQILSEHPEIRAAGQIQVGALFALWEVGEDPEVLELYWNALGSALAALENDDAGTNFVRGVYLWREGDRDRALEVWSNGVRAFGPASSSSAAALEWARSENKTDLPDFSQRIGLLLER